MKASTKLTSKGQVVIPKPVRDRLKWRDGTRLEVDALPGGAVRLSPLTQDPVDQLIGCLAEGDPVGDLEAEHRAEIERDEQRCHRR